METPRRRLCAGRAAGTATALAALAALTGCASYVPEYVPPADGRARPAWRNGTVEPDVAASLPGKCTSDVAFYAANSPPYSAGRGVPSGDFWVPVYFGPRIVVVVHGVAPPVPYTPAHIAAHRDIRGSSSGSLGLGNLGSPGGIKSGGSGGGGGGGGGDAGKAVVLLAILALMTLSFVAVGLSVGRPEPEEEVAGNIDRINAYNDLARTPGSSCSVAAVPQR